MTSIVHSVHNQVYVNEQRVSHKDQNLTTLISVSSVRNYTQFVRWYFELNIEIKTKQCKNNSNFNDDHDNSNNDSHDNNNDNDDDDNNNNDNNTSNIDCDRDNDDKIIIITKIVVMKHWCYWWQ